VSKSTLAERFGEAQAALDAAQLEYMAARSVYFADRRSRAKRGEALEPLICTRHVLLRVFLRTPLPDHIGNHRDEARREPVQRGRRPIHEHTRLRVDPDRDPAAVEGLQDEPGRGYRLHDPAIGSHVSRDWPCWGRERDSFGAGETPVADIASERPSAVPGAARTR